MTQQINLYLAEFRPSRNYLSGRGVLQGAVALAVVLVVLAVVEVVQERDLRSELQLAQERLAAQTNITNELQQNLARRGSDPALVEELSSREQQLAESREMLDFLRGTNLGNISGFSEFMKDLSRAAFDGLWLTEFDLLQGGQHVRLKGIAQQSAMVPDFIGRLSGGRSPLRDRDFSRFLGNRINTSPLEGLEKVDLYQFELETRN